MVGKPPHHGSTGPQPRCFTSARFIRRFTWIPGARNFCLGGSPMVCFSDIWGSETPHFFLRIWWYCICCWFFPGIYEVFWKKTDVWNAYWHNIQIHVQLLCLDSIHFVQIPKKTLEMMIFIANLWHPEFSSSRRFFVWEAVLLSGSKFWFEGKMWRVYWSLLIIRFTWAGVSHAPPPKGKNNRFCISPSSILPKQNEKRFRSFRFSLVFWPPGQLPKIDPTWRIILGLVSGYIYIYSNPDI